MVAEDGVFRRAAGRGEGLGADDGILAAGGVFTRELADRGVVSGIVALERINADRSVAGSVVSAASVLLPTATLKPPVT